MILYSSSRAHLPISHTPLFARAGWEWLEWLDVLEVERARTSTLHTSFCYYENQTHRILLPLPAPISLPPACQYSNPPPRASPQIPVPIPVPVPAPVTVLYTPHERNNGVIETRGRENAGKAAILLPLCRLLTAMVSEFEAIRRARGDWETPRWGKENLGERGARPRWAFLPTGAFGDLGKIWGRHGTVVSAASRYPESSFGLWLLTRHTDLSAHRDPDCLANVLALEWEMRESGAGGEGIISLDFRRYPSL